MKTHSLLVCAALLMIMTATGLAEPPPAVKPPEPVFTKDQVKHFIEVQAPLSGASVADWDTALNVRFTDAEYPLPLKKVKQFLADVNRIPKQPLKSGFQPIKPLVRAKYSDVLAGEDPTVSKADKPPAKADSIKGASFSFTENVHNNSDKWQASGALIVPIVFRPDAAPTGKNWVVDSWGFLPSASLDEVRDSGNRTNDVDSLIYRVGMFAHLYQPNLSALSPFGSIAHELRGYATYGTDLDHRSSVPAGEFDWEPQLNLGEHLALGYRKVIFWRSSAAVHTSIADDALLAYQARLWLHGEFGSVLNSGNKPNLARRDFSRVGPTMELALDPLFLKPLSLTLDYQYYPDFTKFGGIPYTFEATVAWTLWSDPSDKTRKVSLKADYTDGGQDLTRLKQQLLTLGLGFTF